MNQDDRAANHILGVLQRSEESSARTAHLLEESAKRLQANARTLDAMERSQRDAEKEMRERLDRLELDVAARIAQLQASNNAMGEEFKERLAQTAMLLHTAQILEANQGELRESLKLEYKSAASDFTVERKKLDEAVRGMDNLKHKLRSWAGEVEERKSRDTLLISLGSAMGGAFVVLLMMWALGHRPFVVEVSQETFEEADFGRHLSERLSSMPKQERKMILHRIYNQESTTPLQSAPEETKDEKSKRGKGTPSGSKEKGKPRKKGS